MDPPTRWRSNSSVILFRVLLSLKKISFSLFIVLPIIYIYTNFWISCYQLTYLYKIKFYINGYLLPFQFLDKTKAGRPYANKRKDMGSFSLEDLFTWHTYTSWYSICLLSFCYNRLFNLYLVFLNIGIQFEKIEIHFIKTSMFNPHTLLIIS